MNAEQAPLDFDARSWAAKRAHDYRASLATRAKTTGQSKAAAADPEGFERACKASASSPASVIGSNADDVRAWAGPFRSLT